MVDFRSGLQDIKSGHISYVRMLGYGLLWLWTIMMFYSLVPYGVAENSRLSLYVELTLSLVTMVVTVLFVSILMGKGSRLTDSKFVIWTAVFAMLIGSVLSVFGDPESTHGMGILVMGSVLTGSGSAILFICWGEQFFDVGSRIALIELSAGSCLAFVLGFFLSVLPGLVANIIVAVVPIASAWFLHRNIGLSKIEGLEQIRKKRAPVSKSTVLLMLKALAGAVIIGTISGFFDVIGGFNTYVVGETYGLYLLLAGTMATLLLTLIAIFCVQESIIYAYRFSVLILCLGCLLTPFLGDGATYFMTMVFAGYTCFTVVLYILCINTARSFRINVDRCLGLGFVGLYGGEVIVQNGRAVRVEGDEGAYQSMGNCCTKSQSSIQAAYHPDRLHYPMKRTNPKGEEPGWQRISWDEAMDTIIDNIKTLKAKYGGPSLACQVGTSRIWCMHSESILKNLLETPNNIEAWQICKGPRHFATTMVSQFAMSWMETICRPKVYVQWGGASELSNYDDSCRTTVDVASRADVHISCDPRMANMGKEADYWQHLRTGTDGALALAWTNVIIDKHLYDELYTKKWTNAPFLVCEDMEPTGFPTIRTDGSYWDMKTHLLKEADIVEGGSPYKFLVYDNNWQKLADQGIKHQYGAFTWFNADQEGVIDETGGFWEGENYDSDKAREGREAAQENLLPGQIQGWVPDLAPFDPEIDPALEGEFEITLKDGRTVKVKPVWEYYKARAAEYDPATAEKITGIPASEIEAAATAYATRIDPSTGYGNGGIQYMLAIEHACNAIQNCRAFDALVGITGNMDTPGGNRGPTIVPIDGDLQGFSAWAPGASTPPAEINLKQIGRDEFPLLGWWQYWCDGPTIYETMKTSDPYPVRFLWNESGNFMAFANTTTAWEGINSLDFYVDLNLWHTPSTDAADIILPVAHWIELNSPRASQGSAGAMGATVKCVQPPAEARYDPEIVMDLFRRMGEPWTQEPGNEWSDIEWQLADSIKLLTDDELTHTKWHVENGKVSYERVGVPMAEVTPKYKTWDEYVQAFQDHGWWQAKEIEPLNWGTYRRYQTGAMRARDRVWARLDYTAGKGVGDWKPGWFTPTMKQEIWSTVMESHHPDHPEWYLPSWVEPPHGPADTERVKEYPLTATTGRRIPVYFHSEHRQLPWCRELWPVPRIEINPKTADKYGIKQGDWVWIETEWGKIREVADLYYGVDENTVNLEHTWWYPEVQDCGHGFQLSAVNQLIDNKAQDPHSGTSNLRAYQVKIYKATPENSPFNNPVPCDSKGQPIIHTSDDPRLKEWLPTYEGRE